MQDHLITFPARPIIKVCGQIKLKRLYMKDMSSITGGGFSWYIFFQKLTHLY